MRPILTSELNQIKNFGTDLLTGTGSTTIAMGWYIPSPMSFTQWTEGPYDCMVSVQGFAQVQQVGSVSGDTYTLVQQAVIKLPWKYFDGTEPFVIRNAPLSVHQYGVMGQGFNVEPSHSGGGSAVPGLNVIGAFGDWSIISAGKGVADGVEYLVNNTTTIGGAGYRNARAGASAALSHAFVTFG